VSWVRSTPDVAKWVGLLVRRARMDKWGEGRHRKWWSALRSGRRPKCGELDQPSLRGAPQGVPAHHDAPST